MDSEIPKADKPTPVTVPQKRMPTITFKDDGTTKEPDKRMEERAKLEARSRRGRNRMLNAALDELEVAVSNPELDCCGIVEVAREHADAFDMDVIDGSCCYVRNAITDMLRIAGRIE